MSSNVGTYEYDKAKAYRLAGVTLNDFGTTYYENHTPQEITYNAFKKPVSVYEAGNGRVDFEYGPMMNRAIAHYGGDAVKKEDRTYKKIYSAIAPVEVIVNNNTNDTKVITYTMGDAYTAPIAHVSENGVDEFMYLHRDHLGSIMAITDEAGQLVEQTHYGAWGTIQKYWDSAGNNSLGYASVLGRGYTGHEHFASVGLIHMNGRMYDATLGRFLSPDNYIQDPFNTQSFNRYGYVWNNPLKYNDPTGEELITALIIGAVIGAIAGGATAHAKGADGFLEWAGYIVGGAVIGGVSALAGGAAAAAIGESLTVAGAGTIAAAAGGALGGAIAGGGFAALSGQNVGEGIWQGAVSGFVGGGIGAYIGGGGGAFAGGFSSGSLGSAIDGGNFGEIISAGVISGAIAYASFSVQQRIEYNKYMRGEKAYGHLTRQGYRKISVTSQRSLARGREGGGNILNNGDVADVTFGTRKGLTIPGNVDARSDFHTHPGGSPPSFGVEGGSPTDLNEPLHKDQFSLTTSKVYKVTPAGRNALWSYYNTPANYSYTKSATFAYYGSFVRGDTVGVSIFAQPVNFFPTFFNFY